MSNTDDEIWRPIVGFEGYYEVSNMGNIRRLGKTKNRRINYAQIYPTMLLSVNGKHKTYRVHRLVAEAFLPKDIFRTHVNHINGDKTDNRVANLEWVTQAENNLHSYRVLHKQSYFKGKTPFNKKIDPKDIPIMDCLNIGGLSTELIGQMYGIDGSTIRKHLRKYRAANKQCLPNCS